MFAVSVIQSGEKLDLPETVYHVLKHAVNAMQHGRAISLVPEKQDVTTQVAADFLGVSRPHLVKLLESKQLPFHKVGSPRRVYLRDVREFMKRRDAGRRVLLAQLAKDAYEAGYYDKAEIPDGGSDE